MNPLVLMLMTTCLASTTIMTALSHHWLLAWICLELNMLSIMPLMMMTPHPRATEATIKYFITQTIASTLVLTTSILNAWQTGQWAIINTMNHTAMILLTMGIMMKMGVAPMHMWFLEVLQGVPMNTALIISTWQKLAPLALLYTTANQLHTNTLLTLGLLSALLGGLMGLNQTQTRKILACSSISHMGWIVITLPINPQMTTLMMTTYILITTVLFNSLTTTKTNSLLDMGNAWPSSPALLSLTMCTLMSLAGVPPLSGFVPKILILTDMTNLNLLPFATTMALSSLPSLYFYLRLAYLTTLTLPPHTTTTNYKWRFKTHPTLTMTLLNSIALFMLPLTPALYYTM
uniref:NADH-ubiquinone oxidoreductase chain 2 n=1 Tax=Uroplatus phantasticus TaxID=402381 RepID=A7XIC0_9SAUR|nr:NADH dehydrogenase subunit 2 [Uroplatus phantasticus]